MNRYHFATLACSFALMPVALMAQTQQAHAAPKTKIVTDANNGASVTLNTGQILIVRLTETSGAGYSRALLNFPAMPVRLMSYRILPATPTAKDQAPIVGAPVIGEWRFEVAGKAAYGRAVWLKFLQLRPFAKGIEDSNLWEIQVNVPKP